MALDPHGRPMYLPPNASGNALFLDLLRNLLVQDDDSDSDGAPDTLRLLFATPRAWLEDGKTIRVEHAPTAFGPVSILAKSDLSHGKVTVQITPAPRATKATKLRVRLPDGWKVTGASIAGEAIKVGDDATMILPPGKETFSVDIAATR